MLTLFDMSPLPRYRHTDPQTSVDAARSVVPVEDRILEVLVGEMTADDLEARLPGIRRDTLRSALSRLKNTGKVRVVGVGVGASGRQMQKVRVA